MHQKDSFFTLQPCLIGAVFSPTGAHICAPVHYTGAHICVPVHYTGALSERACPTYSRAQERDCPPHRRALMRACPPHRRAPRARLKFLLSRTHASIRWTGAHLCAPSTESPVHVGPHPIKIPSNPCTAPRTYPAQKLKPISMQDDQTTNLILADRRSDTSCSLKLQISSAICSSSHCSSRYK
jgi:hypothetical protein